MRRFLWFPAGAVPWMSLSKQELFDRIRRDSWQRQLSIRALSKKYGVHRRLVREALSSPVPTPRRQPVRTSPRMEPYKKTVDAWLRADLEAPRKQRHTVRRIVARIEEEFGEAIPYPTVRDFVAARRKEIAAQAGAPVEAFVTQRNALGADAEVDFGESTWTWPACHPEITHAEGLRWPSSEKTPQVVPTQANPRGHFRPKASKSPPTGAARSQYAGAAEQRHSHLSPRLSQHHPLQA
ncbi:hypothetical protein ABZ192_35745 [Streptomyces sp. NPDC006235]|uniref:hypothetical protein n=1 Tax=Streptomyces sp. NPDC006235 TaxID=3156736 RepID=UPI0033B4634C